MKILFENTPCGLNATRSSIVSTKGKSTKVNGSSRSLRTTVLVLIQVHEVVPRPRRDEKIEMA
jgi:hypothetical protein